MLINLVGLALVVSGIAAVALDLEWSARLLDYAFSILLGAGLLFRYGLARTVAMGVLLFASFAFIVLPTLFYWSFQDRWQAGLVALAMFGFLPPGVFARILQNAPMLMAASVGVLMTFSGIAYLLYRHLRREAVAAEFSKDGWLAGTSLIGWRYGKVYLVAGACLLFVAAPLIEDHRQQAEKREGQETGYALRLFDQVQFSADRLSIAVTSREDVSPLLVAHLPQGVVLGKPVKTYLIRGPMNGNIPERLSMRLSPDHRYFFSQEHGTGFADLRTDVVRKWDGANGRAILPVGFRSDSASFLYYVADSAYALPESVPVNDKFELLDIGSDRLLYSVDASRPEWRRGDLSAAARKGLLSPDRRYYAYVHRERLHILNTGNGALTILDEPLDRHDQLFFSSESDAIVGNRHSGDEPSGFLHRIGTQDVQRHALHGSILYFSTARGTLIYANDSSVSEYAVPDLFKPRWRIDLAFARGGRVSTDGKYLFAWTPDRQLQFAPLGVDGAPAFKPLKTRLVNSDRQPARLFVADGLLAVTQETKMEILPLEGLGATDVRSQLLDWRVRP